MESIETLSKKIVLNGTGFTIESILKETDCEGIEFSIETVLVTGFLYYLKQNNLLPKEFRVKTFEGCELFYFFLDDDQITPCYKSRSRSKFRSQKSFVRFYNLNKQLYIMPPYKSHFKTDMFTYDKPLLIIYNKYHSEINKHPINFLSKELVVDIIKLLSDKYQIVYEHVSSNVLNTDKFSFDWNNITESKRYIDRMGQFTSSMLNTIRKEYPEVIIFDDLVEDRSYNLTKCQLYASCDNFISVSYGNTALTNLFAKKLLIYISNHEMYTSRAKYFVDQFRTINKEGDIQLADSDSKFISLLETMYLK